MVGSEELLQMTQSPDLLVFRRDCTRSGIGRADGWPYAATSACSVRELPVLRGRAARWMWSGRSSQKIVPPWSPRNARTWSCSMPSR
jgi:hypothetical protein